MSKHLIPRGVLVALALLAFEAGPVAAQGATPAEEDPIRPGDVVRLSVLRDMGLSGEYPVNQFGTVVLPVVGEFDVARETARTLRAKVIEAFVAVRYQPDIELVVLRRVRIIGEVSSQGVYNLDPTMTLADAIAMAHGRTGSAQAGRVLLHRGGRIVDADLRLDATLADSAIRSGDEIEIPRVGWWHRNISSLIGTTIGLAGIAVTIAVGR